MAKFNEQGQQIPDQTPLEIPVGFQVPTDLNTLIRQLVRAESGRAAEMGQETFEEADDFEIESDDPISPYTPTTMQEEAPREAKFLREEEKPKPGEISSPGANDADYQAFLAWKQANAKANDPKNSPSDPPQSGGNQ